MQVVTKNDCISLAVDHSFKANKHMASVNGKPVYSGFFTGINQYGEVRFGHNVYTTGHDELRNSIINYVESCRLQGMSTAKLIYSDIPEVDEHLFKELIPTVRETDEMLKNLVRSADKLDALNSTLSNRYVVDVNNICVVKSNSEICHNKLNSLNEYFRRATPETKVIGLDAEWKVKFNRQGFISGQERVAILQLAYRDPNGKYMCIIIQINKHIPPPLTRLLVNREITFTGLNIRQDIAKLCKDYGNFINSCDTQCIDLATLAKKRNVVEKRTSLDQLVALVLKKELNKDDSVRLSDWSVGELSENQRQYAAADAVSSLELYYKLLEMPDLSKRLTSQEAKNHGRLCDIIVSGNRRTANCTIVDMNTAKQQDIQFKCRELNSIKKQNISQKNLVVVQVTKLLSPGMIVPYIEYKDKENKEPITLEFLQKQEGLPFQIALPLSYLAPSISSSTMDVHSGVGSSNVLAEQADDDDEEEENNDNYFTFTDNGGDQNNTSNENFDRVDELPEIESIHKTVLGQLQDIGSSRGGGTIVFRVPNEPTELDEFIPKDKIEDVSGSVLADGFHIINRIKVSKGSVYLKLWSFCFMEAYYTWDPIILALVCEKLKTKHGLSEEKIQKMRFYNIDYFRRRVPRKVELPSILYFRLRALFATFGSLIEPDTNVRFFNTSAKWKTANNILKLCLKGMLSDPPGFPLYYKRINPNGSIVTDSDGLVLYGCMRSSSQAEGYHSSLSFTFGNWTCAPRKSSCLHTERRHRNNQNSNEKNRAGYPKIGHYQTWYVDKIQHTYSKNFCCLYMPNWINTLDFVDTKETFDIVPLHDQNLDSALQDKVKKLKDSNKFEPKMNYNLRYLAQRTRTPLPFLPFMNKEERNSFSNMILESVSFNADTFALKWIDKVDGVTHFPKMPSHLTQQYKQWMKNNKVKVAAAAITHQLNFLKRLNEDNSLSNAQSNNPNFPTAAMIITASPLKKPPIIQIQDSEQIQRVGGLLFDTSDMITNKEDEIEETETTCFLHHPTPTDHKRKGDRKKRQPRSCYYCQFYGNVRRLSHECPGAASNRNLCRYYNENGTLKLQ